MATFQHPASLNPLQQFSQAFSVLRHTSRAKNNAWYSAALDLDLQLHIRVDGSTSRAYFFERNKSQWSEGPSISEDLFHNESKSAAFISEMLRFSRAHGATSIGVILHVADEFATTELKPELDNPAALPELRASALTDPKSILQDSSINTDQASWRVLPYPAAGSEVIGTTVTLSRNYAAFFDVLREASESEDYPIVTHALSSPLVAIMGLSDLIQPTPGKPYVVILQYPWLTVLAFFNEHSDLRLIRTLQHRGLRRPTNFRNSLTTTNASLEFVDPDLYLFPLGENPDTSLMADLKISFSASRVEEISIKPFSQNIPTWCAELGITTHLRPVPELSVNSHTFSILREDGWALQNFLPTPAEISEIFPSRSEMSLLRGLRFALAAVILLAILGLGFLGFQIVEILRSPEWSFDASQAQIAKGRLAQFTTERKKSQHWSNLMEDRSKAWVSMESLSRLFPENGGMLVKSYTHSLKPESTPGKVTVGFVKEWKITGLARDEALDTLNTINTREGINAHFSEIARVTGNESFNPNVGNRNLVVNVRTQENSSFKPIPADEANRADESTYSFTFDMTITQRFEATDPLAISASKSP